MKLKYIFVSSILLLALGAYAQTSRFSKLPLLDEDLPSVQPVQPSQSPAWQTQFTRLAKQFSQLHPKLVTDSHLPPLQATVLTQRDQQTYLSRLIRIQRAVQQNDTLHTFTFVTPQAEDLVRLFPEKLETLENFLRGKQTPVIVERNCPFTLAMYLGKGSRALEIWIDIPTQKIYLMSDNFYTTSAGKYGLHLK